MSTRLVLYQEQILDGGDSARGLLQTDLLVATVRTLTGFSSHMILQASAELLQMLILATRYEAEYESALVKVQGIAIALQTRTIARRGATVVSVAISNHNLKQPLKSGCFTFTKIRLSG